MGKVVLLNDTYAWYHWGCTATSSAIRKRIRQLGFQLISVPINSSYGFRSLPTRIDQFDDFTFFQQACLENQELFGTISEADVVVINGEGTMHHAPDAMGWATPVLRVCGYCESPPFFVNLYRETMCSKTEIA